MCLRSRLAEVENGNRRVWHGQNCALLHGPAWPSFFDVYFGTCFKERLSCHPCPERVVQTNRRTWQGVLCGRNVKRVVQPYSSPFGGKQQKNWQWYYWTYGTNILLLLETSLVVCELDFSSCSKKSPSLVPCPMCTTVTTAYFLIAVTWGTNPQ
jgi:hypothetical protein